MILSLSKDIIDVILTTLPDFSTLLSVILVAKEFHDVFETRPSSIIRAVANNQFGPVLPQALRLARVEVETYTPQAKIKPELLKGLPDESNILKSAISRQEAAVLARNARVADNWEAEYSFRHKNIRSKASQLSDIEALRFHRALYRYWLHWLLFCDWDDEEQRDDEDDELNADNDEDAGELSILERPYSKFYAAFPTIELQELSNIVQYLDGLTSWIIVASKGYRDPFVEKMIMASSGPTMLLELYRNVDSRPYYFQTTNGYSNSVYECLSVVLNQRDQVHLEQRMKEQFILDEPEGNAERCNECQYSTRISDLYCSTNWRSLKGVILSQLIYSSLPGLLARNEVETQPINSLLPIPRPLWNLVASVFDWSDQRTLCLGCFLKELGRHLMQWLIEKKSQTPRAALDDCWYGYNCRTQTHKQSHRDKLNHLCEPSRGDAPI